MYLGYDSAAVENLGKPTVMTMCRQFVADAGTGVSVRGVPGLRLVPTSVPTHTDPVRDEEGIIREGVKKAIDDIVVALTKPLTEEEKSPKPKVEKPSRIVFKGNLEEVHRFFYKTGLSYGAPIIPPTEEAVAEMLTGTDLPPDHVVAKIPPREGKATVEKIAINAVMAGCLPTYMPVLIAAVQAMVDPELIVVGYSCSVASWAPLLTINGPIRNDLHVNSGMGLFSPYFIPNTAIGHAIGFITQNIGGIRPGIEDVAGYGHEGRYGMCIAENEEDSPWEPLHVEKGLKKGDSAVTIFYPNGRSWLQSAALYGMIPRGVGVDAVLRRMLLHLSTFGGNPGNALIMMPGVAKMFADEGWTKKDIISYLVEYARWPAADFGWPPRERMRGIGLDSEIPEVPVARDPTLPRRIFRSSKHMMIVVAGGSIDQVYTLSLGGGGDYGGPATRKIELPRNWNALVKKYKGIVPTYAHY